MTGTTDDSERGDARPGSVRGIARSPVLVAALVIGGLAVLALWLVLRGNLDDAPLEALPGDRDMPVVAPDAVGGLSGPVQTVCAEPAIWAATDMRPAFVAAVISSGQADVCVDVYRLPDEDAEKDYYRAVASGWWTTQAVDVQWPWQARGEPAGEVWVELTWDPESLDNYWQTEWAVLGECQPDGTGGTRQLPGLAPFGSPPSCMHGTGAIGQPGADVRHVTWSVAAPQAQHATAMVLDISVAEGEVPDFIVAVRQVDIEG